MQEKTLPDSIAHVGARISPDGKHLIATTVDGKKLLIFDVTAQRWSELAHLSVNAIQWSPDSRYVYFDTQASEDPVIYRLGISDRKIEPVASVKDTRRVVETQGTWIGLSPDGSPLITRDTGTQQVYALDFEEP